MSCTKFYVIDINDSKWEISQLDENESAFYKSMYTAVTNRDFKAFMELKDSTPGWVKFLNKGTLMKVIGQDQSGAGQNVAMNLCHLAAISQARDILRVLIKSGGNLSKRCVGINDTSNRKKFIFKETLVDLILTHFREPVLFIRHLMDDSIKCHDMGSSYEYVLDFTILHPQTYKRFVDGSRYGDNVLAVGGGSSSHQMTVLNAILNSTDDIHSEQYELLQHPLIEAFLTCKWKYYRSFFFLLVLLHFIFVISLSTAAIVVLRCIQQFSNESFNELLRGHRGGNGPITNDTIISNRTNETVVSDIGDASGAIIAHVSTRSVFILNIFTLITGVLLSIHAIIQAHFIPLKKLIYEFEIISNLLTAPCAIVKCIIVLILPYGWYFDNHHKWIYRLSSFIILPAWINLMLIIGRFPRLGCYSLMFTTVMRNFLKVMISFVFLIIGFALSFALMFPNSEHFKDSPLALVRTIVMMVGEFDYLSTFTNEEDVKHRLFDRGLSTDTIRVTRDDRQGLSNTVYEKLLKDIKPEYNINRRPSCIPFYSGQ